ncbi:MAG: hypothetical protein ACHQ5A_05435, partial [Opitutales bacterium]
MQKPFAKPADKGFIAGMPPRSLCRLLSCLLPLLAGFVAGATAANSAPSIDDRVRELLGRMTVEEKVGQLVQYSSRKDMTGPASKAALAPTIEAGGVGSLLNIRSAAETR